MEADVSALFIRYQRAFEEAISGDLDLDEVAGFYAEAFIAASPAGVRAGKNDAELRTWMAQGYEHYRAIGTKAMRLRDVRISPIDDHHCVAHVAWTGVYARKGQADAVIDFEVHYLVQHLDRTAKVFGWVSGDEQAVLQAHGVG